MSPRTLGLMVRAYSEHEPHKRVRRFAIVVPTLGFVGAVVLIFVARERAASGGSAVAAARVNMPAPQQPGIQRPSRLRSRLSQQLDADRLRRNLGERFLIAGREQTTLTGMLTVGTNVRPVRIVRTQHDNGEEVEISIGNASANLTWNPTDGAKEDGQSAAGSDRALIERVVLDSPDQFVLAQLRRSSYRLLARNVVPGGIKDLENYSGPAWDVIKVGEPDSPASTQTLSPSRLYYINGVRPNGSYALSDIENVSMTNGNVSLSIPLASLPPIAGGKLSWTVNAVYNGKLWDIMKLEDVTDVGATRFTKDKIQASDFGGWRVGRAYELVFQKPDVYDFDWLGPDPNDAVDVALFNLHPYHTWAKVQLITPDGTTHELRPLDYLPYNGIHDFLWSYYWQAPDTISPRASMRYYSLDGSYIWAEIQPNGGNTLWDVYLPDGTHIRQKVGLQRIFDTNGNSIVIRTDEVSPGYFVTHYQDEMATGAPREITASGGFFMPEQIQYQTPDGRVRWRLLT